MNKLTICILGTRGIPARYGGFETFAEHLSIGLVNKGHFVHVYCPKYQEYKASVYQNVQLIFISNYEYIFKTRILRAVCNLIYDIICLLHSCTRSGEVHIYMLGYSAGPFLFLPKFFGKKLIINPDGLEWKSTRWGFFVRCWLYFCEWISVHCAHQLIGDAQPISDRFLKVHGARIATIEYGTELFVDDGSDLEYPKFSYYLAVARMVPETKVNVIIEGFKKANLTNKRLLIVGPVTDKLFFESQILPHIDKNTILYLGAVYDVVRLKKLRANASALLHGHASDGTNPSLLESMGCSSPVISLNRESNIKVLRDNALYFDDSESLALVLNKFESFPIEKRIEIGKKNYSRAMESFSWESSILAHEALFKNI